MAAKMKTYGKTISVSKDKLNDLLIRNKSCSNSNKSDNEKLMNFGKLFASSSSSKCQKAQRNCGKSNKKLIDKKKVQQSLLQFGQKPLSTLIKCPVCLMEYNTLRYEDTSLHNKYHAKILDILTWSVFLY